MLQTDCRYTGGWNSSDRKGWGRKGVGWRHFGGWVFCYLLFFLSFFLSFLLSLSFQLNFVCVFRCCFVVFHVVFFVQESVLVFFFEGSVVGG